MWMGDRCPAALAKLKMIGTKTMKATSKKIGTAMAAEAARWAGPTRCAPSMRVNFLATGRAMPGMAMRSVWSCPVSRRVCASVFSSLWRVMWFSVVS